MNDELEQIIGNEAKYRRDQIYRAVFNPEIGGFSQITTLPLDLRKKLETVPWLPVKAVDIKESAASRAKKALLELAGKELIETVLMERLSKKADKSRSRYTVCLSTQIGCPMRCAFCATGQLGFKRNLTIAEIIGQYRFWQIELEKSGGKIDNIVFMGQGEPLLNYEALRESANLFIKYAGIGPTKITISSAGVVPAMKRMLEDPEFPPVRFALSLHSAVSEDRKKLMPAHNDEFFTFFTDWCKQYQKRWPSRTHFIGLEYVFISGVNDSDRHLKALIKLSSGLGRVRINLIPLNPLNDKYRSSPVEKIKEWQNKLMEKGFTVTIRLSQGSDIAAACGQLRNLYDGAA